MERSGNIGRRDGGGSCASAVDDTAKDECVGIDGIPEREKQFPFYTTIQKDFKGNYDAYVDHCYDNSIFSNEANFNKFIKKPTVKAIEKDPMKMCIRDRDTSCRRLSFLARPIRQFPIRRVAGYEANRNFIDREWYDLSLIHIS